MDPRPPLNPYPYFTGSSSSDDLIASYKDSTGPVVMYGDNLYNTPQTIYEGRVALSIRRSTVSFQSQEGLCGNREEGISRCNSAPGLLGIE